MQPAMRDGWDRLADGGVRKGGSRAAALHERLRVVGRMVLISLPFGEDTLGDENLDGTHELGVFVCWRGFDWSFEGAAGGAADAGTEGSARADGEGAGIGGRHRTQSDDPNEGWRETGDGHLPAEERDGAGADYLGAHAV